MTINKTNTGRSQFQASMGKMFVRPTHVNVKKLGMVIHTYHPPAILQVV
jgi:hypothetical protein